MQQARKPWAGRFQREPDPRVEAFIQSLDCDKEMATFDVAGSIAHAKMLAKTRILTETESARIVEGLEQVRKEIEGGTFPWRVELEDVHMNVETRLGELIGKEIAGKLHTGRSRNDQVALDERLYLRDALERVQSRILGLEKALVAKAKEHVDTLMPGYTHLQRAQPVRLAHYLLAYREMFERDRGRAKDALDRANASPLGAGAPAGTLHPVDREYAAELLRFPTITRNSLDAVGSRAGLLEALSAAAISMVNLSRLCEELVVFSSQEFRFVVMTDAVATGSSMMPQKRNPDVAELIRGKCGRVTGSLVSLLMTTKGLPLAYNRDLQEDKPALFDALRTWNECLEMAAITIQETFFDGERMRAALSEGFVCATELADYLSSRIPFREAHQIVGKIVTFASQEGKALEELTLEELRTFHPSFENDVFEWLDFERSVERRDLPGGPAKKRVLAEIARLEASLGGL